MDRFMKRPKFLKCFVTNITTTRSEIEMWCQTDAKAGSRVETALDLFHNQLSILFAINSQNLRPVPTPQNGQNYLTHMKSDLHFHRIVVTHVDNDLSRASVLFIDFGVEDWVPFNHLVQFDELFEIEPLAQKFFLADIQTKDNEWNTEEVKRCLQPFLMSVFQCEVIGVNKNTECIRVYDQFFAQPLVQCLVKHCNGFLTYPSFSKEIFEAIDLSIDKRELNSVETNYLRSEFLDKQNSKSMAMESFAKHITSDEEVKDEFISDKENICPITKSEVNENITQLNDENTQIEDIQSVTIERDSPPSVHQNEEICHQPTTTQLNGSIPQAIDETLNQIPNEGNHKEEESVEQTVTQELEVNEKESDRESPEEEFVAKDTKECDTIEETVIYSQPPEEVPTKPLPTEEINEIKCNGEESNDSNTSDQINIKSGGDSVDSAQNVISDEVPPKQEVNGQPIDLCPYREYIGQKISVYFTFNVSDKFYVQLSSQFDVIQSLTERMTEFYNKIYGSNKNSLDLKSVEPNDIIAARFSGDSLWYRASVETNTGTHLVLVYIDFGNEETVEIKECKQLVEEFATKGLKPQALLCQPIADKISPQTVDKYINDMPEVLFEFVDFESDCFKIRILSVK